MENISTNSISNIGFITTASRLGLEGGKKLSEKEASSEDYVGKITAIFTPYLSQNISEGKFISLHSKVKNIVAEIRGKSL